MKLLVCASEYFPQGSGIANVAYNVVEQLKKQGVQCTICSPTGPDIKLGSQKLIEKTGIIGLIYYWHCVAKYFKSNDDFDVLWFHNPFFVKRNPFQNSLITMHSTYYGESIHNVGITPFLRIYKKIVSAIERFCLIHINKNTRFTGVGQPVCEELETIGIAKEQIVYVPNGVDTNKFQPSKNKKIVRKKFGIPEEDIVLLSVGRLTPAKQPHIMLDVFSALEKKVDKVTLCIAGRGELLESTQKYAKKMGIRNIKFLGHVDYQEDLPGLYASCDYYFMTSKYEGSPLTLLEAMASGLPCIVSAIPNLGVVREADCGVIVNFDHKEDTIQYIEDYLFLGHPEHAENARKHAVKNLDWKIISEQYLNEFSGIIKNQ